MKDDIKGRRVIKKNITFKKKCILFYCETIYHFHTGSILKYYLPENIALLV